MTDYDENHAGIDAVLERLDKIHETLQTLVSAVQSSRPETTWPVEVGVVAGAVCDEPGCREPCSWCSESSENRQKQNAALERAFGFVPAHKHHRCTKHYLY